MLIPRLSFPLLTTDYGLLKMWMLGIETSCDETSVALLRDDGLVRSNLIASQIARHRPFGGVVPEIASREHLQHLMPLLEQALAESKLGLADIGAIAVTSGPGLIGALLVGVATAQGIAYGLRIPLVAVNHLAGHAFSGYLQADGPAIPLPPHFLSLVVSGGHSSIYEVRKEDGAATVRMLSRTRDDAAGEIFDKVGKVLGLPYPGGPYIDRLAQRGNPERHRFPVAQFKDDSADFSFSGLKATAIRLARAEGLAGAGDVESNQALRDFCASFQKAIGDQILDRLSKVWSSMEPHQRPQELCFAGGVAANSVLRARVANWSRDHGVVARIAEHRYCTDNAAMIAFAGLQRGRVEEAAVDTTRVRAAGRMPLGVA
jgi:N6-L-threonylcarbamoyladenine synthase